MFNFNVVIGKESKCDIRLAQQDKVSQIFLNASEYVLTISILFQESQFKRCSFWRCLDMFWTVKYGFTHKWYIQWARRNREIG